MLFFCFILCLYCIMDMGAGKAMAGIPIPVIADSSGIEIKGTVTDTLGTPIPGVTVSLKGNPKVGTAVDPNGKFLLTIPNKYAVLIFRMMGYDAQEVPVAGRNEINVVLKSNAAALGEVVVVAFGKQKKQDMIGAVTSVNVGDLKTPSSNLTTALAGQISGMIAYQRSGEPGADNADFFIRGVTTFGYKKDPLILIDGIEVTPKDLARLQPDDVASFSILKDATATSLYGARGANGVMLITTKEGKEGQLSVSVRVENSVSAPTRNIELADPITYMKMGNEAVLTRNPLGIPTYAQSKIDNTIAGGNPAVYPTTDWQKELFKKYAINQRVNLNGSGGGKVARYYLAGTFNQDNGVLKVDGKNNFNSNVSLKTYSLRSNININMTPTTEAIVRLSGTFDDYNGPIDGGDAVYKQVMHANPVLFPAFYEPDEANSHVKHILFGNYGSGNYLNPYANLVRGYKEYASSKMDAQFELKQDLSFWTKGLTARVLFNTSRYTFYDVSRYYTPFYYMIGSYNRKSDIYQLTALNETTGKEYLEFDQGAKDVTSATYLEASVNYQRSIKGGHDLSGTLVSIMRNSIVGNAGDLQSSLPFRNTGISGRATYSYRSRYYAEFNFGYNGSERFYKTQRFGFFPSAGIAWNISNEDFWKPIHPVVSNLKLRATYGLVGNDAIGNERDRFFYLSNVNMDDETRAGRFGTQFGYVRNGVSVSRYSNTDITWEKSYKTNIGFETTVKDKLTIEADYFHEYRTNILMNRASIPSTMGLSAVVRANVGEAIAKGIDGSIVYSDFFGKNFWIKARANFTFATSAFKVYEEPQYAEAYKLHEGHSLSQQWGYIAERMFLDDAEVKNSPRQNFGIYQGGDLKYRDVNGDGQITELDQVPLGYPTDPEIIYGFGFSIGYKRFDLSVFFQGSARSSFWIDAGATAPFINETQLLKAYADSYWSEDNRNSYALWPRLSSTSNKNNIQRSSWFMRDGDFLRMKTLEMGYTLPKRTNSMVWLSNARFYLSGINLFALSKFKLWDVEMGGNGLGYPVQRVVNAGILITL
jgi:TonB-linked SusC/RagA family outer membrane protein